MYVPILTLRVTQDIFLFFSRHCWSQAAVYKFVKKYFSTLSNLWGIYIQYTFEWKIVLPAVYIMGKLSSCTFSLLHDKDNMHGPLTRLVYCEENGFRNDFLFL